MFHKLPLVINGLTLGINITVWKIWDTSEVRIVYIYDQYWNLCFCSKGESDKMMWVLFDISSSIPCIQASCTYKDIHFGLVAFLNQHLWLSPNILPLPPPPIWLLYSLSSPSLYWNKDHEFFLNIPPSMRTSKLSKLGTWVVLKVQLTV